MKKRSEKPHRPLVEPAMIGNANNAVHHKLLCRLAEKGYGSWVSRHEILGMLTEEYTEVVEAVHSGSLQEVREELIDVAVGCLFGVACIDNESLDW